MTPKHTLADKVLCAALRLDAEGHARFTAADLAVEAWRADAETFGLSGYEDDHVDCNVTNVCIMGKRGLPAKGYLAKSGKHYSLTPAGRKRAEMFVAPAPVPSPVREYAVLGEGEARELALLFASTAWSRRSRDDINRADAVAFWGGHPSGLGTLLKGIAERLEVRPAVLPGGREVTARDVEELLDLHRWLVGRFGREKVKA